jgi:hypothetical protein
VNGGNGVHRPIPTRTSLDPCKIPSMPTAAGHMVATWGRWRLSDLNADWSWPSVDCDYAVD